MPFGKADILLPLLPEQVHLVLGIARTAVKAVLPSAEQALFLLDAGGSAQTAEHFLGFHIKKEQASWFQEQADPAKHLFQFPQTGKVVDAVQTAHRSADGTVQVQFIGLLADPYRGYGQIGAFFTRHAEHLLGSVAADHFISLLRQQPGQGAGAAAKLQHQPGIDAVLVKKRTNTTAEAVVDGLVDQAVIAVRQARILIHFTCAARCRARS